MARLGLILCEVCMYQKRDEAACARKIRHRTEAGARMIEINSKYLLRAYKCTVCAGWHLTKMARCRTATIV